MSLQITLQPTPSQTLNTVLGNQYCQINIYQKKSSGSMFIDLTANNVPIISGTICLNKVRVVRQIYKGFIGDLMFVDTQGNDDPQYAGLNSRWVLLYLTKEENAEFQ